MSVSRLPLPRHELNCLFSLVNGHGLVLKSECLFRPHWHSSTFFLLCFACLLARLCLNQLATYPNLTDTYLPTACCCYCSVLSSYGSRQFTVHPYDNLFWILSLLYLFVLSSFFSLFTSAAAYLTPGIRTGYAFCFAILFFFLLLFFSFFLRLVVCTHKHSTAHLIYYLFF